MKTVPDHVFRGYDLRGVVGTDLDDENVLILAKGYATYLLQRRIYDCVIGFDSRESSPRFRDIFVKGLTESGIKVLDIGITLSQICYFAQYFFRTRGMVMITASHNPKEYNGFKLGTGYSETMVTEEIVAFRELVKSGQFIKLDKLGEHVKYDIFPDYQKDLLRRIGTIKKFKIVVDSCAATTGLFLPKILRSVGCEVIEQNTTPDPTFPVGVADPTEREVQERLAKRVVEEKADLGFSYDTDGDRMGVVDNEGNLIWNDTLVSIFSKDVLDFAPGSKVIFNVLCSKQVDEVIKLNGGVGIMWKTGHSFIKAKVREEKAIFGGELSGHFFFVDNFYGHDDGAIASLRLLAYLTRVNKSLREVISELPKYFSSPEIKVGCADNIKFSVVTDKIGGEIKKLYPTAKYVESDGVRMDTEDEMMIVRASQNGPYLTIKFEGKTQEKYDQLKTQVAKILHSISEVDFKSGVNVDSLS
ncbi:phosphomannomutase/phosphoglucomutase [Candidatus Roizmanbacteria bacterium CG_4_9_14_3_um_filter_33_18]|uniref:Phosphomannomutase/phosphoglucomutase n=5 Tax=Candidatus Roizmaniibacteriota TaxID=1752723 RepID=A0A2M7AVE4_9BACT|nr:MAG: phosphomannomutase [Candidatus Roizmanbacteria bacterium CG22_combo_CG10-13_8_21_14_all_34_12]PIU36433.1 MAG: phosphomannomutase/phosphoglucomutase [Candidatus Roizmanbacteria bacterium CG07_land_8_20_14_0_80_34_15]PIU74610.1 MAG: phosphomannomutase/phosphoglucomutase [Candidatus Roizmanbacteria bacterium CG06_land_8_20_14_3_00_34_14]PIW73698.1 MAG: phosphomannomutase/phosphoglucomutase [Candidatus Roizmanbacteria bacterium CG_4_8_14_3_um_filter_34_9]PJA56006.1 MAG: phosphomannomutase/p